MMDRMNKLQSISTIAERLEIEINQLKSWIKNEIEELNRKSHLLLDEDTGIAVAGQNQNPRQHQNYNDLVINSQDQTDGEMIIDNIDIKNEIEDEEEFILGTFEQPNPNPANQTVHDQETDPLNFPEQCTSHLFASSTTTSCSSASSSTLEGFKKRRLIFKKTIPKPKKVTNFCTICQIKFDSIQSFRQHKEIHFNVPVHYKYITSARGNPLLEADGHFYRRCKESQTSIYWICVFKTNDLKDKCLAKAITTLDGENVRLTAEHCHEVRQRKQNDGNKRKIR